MYESKSVVISGDFFIQKIDDRLVSLDPGIGLNANAPIDDGLSKSNPTPNIQDVLLGKAINTGAPHDEIYQGLARVFVTSGSHARSIPLQIFWNF